MSSHSDDRPGEASLDRRVEADYSNARLRAFLSDLAAFLFGKENDLLSFDEVRYTLRVRSQAYAGIRPVEVSKIVGSVDRYRDFDRAFMPTQSHTAARWKRVDRAHYQAIALPPVSLFKVGEIYFVRDGHHRVSVAREQGVEFIDAEIIECSTRVPVSSTLRPEDLIIVGEYADFLERTGLDRLRPEQPIQFSIPGQYPTLVQHIETHCYFLAQEQQRYIPWEEGVVSWYDHLFVPIVTIIRERDVLAHFPGRTEADLYLWIMDHLHYLKEQYGSDLSLETAAEDFTRHFSRKPINVLQRSVKQALNGVGRTVGHIVSAARQEDGDTPSSIKQEGRQDAESGDE